MGKRIAIGVVAAAVLIGAGLWADAQVQSPPFVPPLGTNAGSSILSGADVGFRVDRWEGDTPVGRWVVRVDGKWVEVRTSGGIRRLTSR